MTAPITSELNLATRFGVLVSGTGAADTITPDGAPPGQPLVGAGPDVILALGGDDLLDGGFGADLMLGGDGDDTYVVDDLGDLVMEFPFGGWDTVRSSISYSLDAAPDTRFTVENLALTGAAAIDGTGNSLDNLLTGNAAANARRPSRQRSHRRRRRCRHDDRRSRRRHLLRRQYRRSRN